MGKRWRKRRGHFCWCCGHTRPNERFSGRGHRDHICKGCQKLPKTEREFRQAVRNMDRLRNWDGLIGRKQRPQLERFLAHSSDRIRTYAEQLFAQDHETREERRQDREAEEAAFEAELRVHGWDETEVEDDGPPAANEQSAGAELRRPWMVWDHPLSLERVTEIE